MRNRISGSSDLLGYTDNRERRDSTLQLGATWHVRTTEKIAELQDLLRRLSERDRDFRTFGSDHHRYEVGPVLTEEELSCFEANHGIFLPADYRCFLSTVGNGGAGPFYGMAPLDAFGRNLSKPFPLTEAADDLPDATIDELGGILEFCEQGCGTYSYLVVCGPAYGTVWDGGDRFRPTHESFTDWYRDWAEHSMRALEAEAQLAARIRVGMTITDVINELRGEWRIRKTSDQPIYVVESCDFWAELELDDDDVVVKITPRFLT